MVTYRTLLCLIGRGEEINKDASILYYRYSHNIVKFIIANNRLYNRETSLLHLHTVRYVHGPVAQSG